MWSLRLYRGEEELGRLPLTKNLIRLGRSSDCDLSFEDPELSREHVSIRKKESGWRLEDCSRNGIYIDRQRLEAPHVKLQEKTRYHLSPRLSFEIESLKPSQDVTRLSEGRLTELVVLGANEQGFEVSEAELSLSSGKSIPLVSSHFSIGRHPSNDLVLEAKEISLFHCQIRLERNAYWIRDLESTNGLQVDGVSVTNARLQSNHLLKLGPIEIHFSQKPQSLYVSPKNRQDFFGMQSKSPKMRRLFDWAESIAGSELPILIKGETGTGKELMAKAIHSLSSRGNEDLVSINCAALPRELAESELFGHEKGAFTSAHQQRKGAFERANQGSLFLDEVAELELPLQAKLLRVLETGDYMRVGGEQVLSSQARVIAATHKSLEDEVAKGRFRADLYYRLQILPLELPSLRERKEDLELLCADFLKDHAKIKNLSSEALDFLKSYAFPGNIRELRNLLWRARLIAHNRKADQIELEDLSFLKEADQFQKLNSSKDLDRRQEIEEALASHNFSQTKAAQALGIPISTLHDRMKKYGIEKKRKSS